MTSPGPRGCETRGTAGTGGTVLAYSGGVIDRAASQRSDPGWIDATLAKASTRLMPMWRDQCVVSGEPATPVILPAAEAEPALKAAAAVVFLGLDDHGGIFAADLSQAGESQAVEAADGERVLDVRALVGIRAPAEAALLGYARGILYWHRHQRYWRQRGAPPPPRPWRAPQDVPERGVRAPAFPAGRARSDHARRVPGQVPAGPA
jgi:hypothetical protein